MSCSTSISNLNFLKTISQETPLANQARDRQNPLAWPENPLVLDYWTGLSLRTGEEKKVQRKEKKRASLSGNSFSKVRHKTKRKLHRIIWMVSGSKKILDMEGRFDITKLKLTRSTLLQNESNLLSLFFFLEHLLLQSSYPVLHFLGFNLQLLCITGFELLYSPYIDRREGN